MKSVLSLLILLLNFSPFAYAQDSAGKVYESAGLKFRYENLMKRSDAIWGFDFLSDGKIIFTERRGTINTFDPATKQVTPLTGTPEVWAQGQGGMLDVRVHPTNKNEIFFTYAMPLNKGGTTAVGRATLDSNKLTNVKRLFIAHSESKNGEHFGSRIEFDNAGHIFFAVGDRGERPRVQDLSFHMGKVMRIKEDGSVPQDNPFVKTKNAKPEIWALGVRSPQGLTTHPETKELWEAEMGPRGGDEINIIAKGKNYGWPVITYGREYWGPKIGEEKKEGMEQPLVYWVPSISPSALTFYTGSSFPTWKNNAFLANLSGQHLRRLVIKDNKVIQQEELLSGIARFRNVRTGPDGHLYVSTDDGQISRLVPAK
ncbi:hypothetical protein AZI86_01455 [Bdellovibrio bacteriovorus]|uniref:Glucose/Sorbosone dehydrogenase domain-containing protein n=1 Tax=Bdellovibrio bacteriovorus TaxID=959 RepID=A0A150WN96_BDEBC|nr:PQQ-dependent sugar dehydrogenase [Bdellovibrio bacteriovorus]KYG65769.1 hypothetical protein AZI86_01455 [Bdellovibrio bacteriovorus]